MNHHQFKHYWTQNYNALKCNCLYVVRKEDATAVDKENPYKVGITNNILSRLNVFQNWIREFHIYRLIIPSPDAIEVLERVIHSELRENSNITNLKFTSKYYKGKDSIQSEWFQTIGRKNFLNIFDTILAKNSVNIPLLFCYDLVKPMKGIESTIIGSDEDKLLRFVQYTRTGEHVIFNPTFKYEDVTDIFTAGGKRIANKNSIVVGTTKRTKRTISPGDLVLERQGRGLLPKEDAVPLMVAEILYSIPDRTQKIRIIKEKKKGKKPEYVTIDGSRDLNPSHFLQANLLEINELYKSKYDSREDFFPSRLLDKYRYAFV